MGKPIILTVRMGGDTMGEVVNECMEELNQLVTAYPRYIPVGVAANFLHLKPEALRASIEQNRCPFA